MKKLFVLSILALVAGCEAPYDHMDLSTGGDSSPRLVQSSERAATLRHGTIARVVPRVWRGNSIDDDMKRGELLLRSRDPNIVRIDPGRDPLEFYFSGAKLGSVVVDVFDRGHKVDEIAVDVVAP